MSGKLKESKDPKSELKSIEIHIGNWMITADSYQYILQRGYESKKGKNAGKVSYSTEGFYPRLEDLLISLLEKRLKDSDVQSISKLLKEVQKSKKEILEYAKVIREELKC